MSTTDRRHCLICDTWWPLEDEDTPRECPTCQERGAAATQPCRQPGCPWQRDHDYGIHELTRIVAPSKRESLAAEAVERVREMAERADRHGYNIEPADVFRAVDGAR